MLGTAKTLSGKTKKKKNIISNEEKLKLWNIFDDDKKVLDNHIDTENVTDIEKKESSKNPTECVYSVPKDLDNCELCGSYLVIMENGFPTCTNSKCGIIYKDILDTSPEWRFCGLDDHHNVDPTRCGMPINPFLEESSYGCKVIIHGRVPYEMRKIKRYTEIIWFNQ